MGRGIREEPETILLVEDEPLVRLDLAEMLEDAGYQVLEAANADIALKVLAADPDRVTILMTDVNMPGSLDGLELARIVHAQWPHIRLIVTSGQMRPSDGMIPGHGRFVSKPFLSETMVRAIVESGQTH